MLICLGFGIKKLYILQPNHNKEKQMAVKKTVKKTTKAKPKATAKKAFGGYAISFKGCKDPVEKVFGEKPISPSEMTKKLWVYVKAKKLSNK